jgi:hypothetical protein
MGMLQAFFAPALRVHIPAGPPNRGDHLLPGEPCEEMRTALPCARGRTGEQECDA